MVRIFTNHPIIPFVYSGPGDIVSGANGWWGLRAYSLTSIGSNAVRLRRDSDNAEQNFTTVFTGDLDIAAILSFKGSTNLFVSKLYDQTGNGIDLVQSTAAQQPSFSLSALGSKPAMAFVRANSTTIDTVATIPIQSQPGTISFVAIRTTSGSSLMSVYRTTGPTGGWNTGFGNATDSVYLYAGSVVSTTAIDNVWHAVQAVFNDPTSDGNVDGNSNSLSPGNAQIGSGTDQMGGGGVGQGLDGKIVEMGRWMSAFSSTDSSNMSANQHSYWGF